MNRYWAQGFEKRCEELGVDPELLRRAETDKRRETSHARRRTVKAGKAGKAPNDMYMLMHTFGDYDDVGYPAESEALSHGELFAVLQAYNEYERKEKRRKALRAALGVLGVGAASAGVGAYAFNRYNNQKNK